MSLWNCEQWDEIGECTWCGAKDVQIKVVDEDHKVCERCLGDEFFKCDRCGQYWLDEEDIRVETEDGQSLCPWCADS